MSINLRMEAVHLKEPLSINWVCKSGLVENMELVVEEYRQTRGLLVSAAQRQRNTSAIFNFMIVVFVSL